MAERGSSKERMFSLKRKALEATAGVAALTAVHFFPIHAHAESDSSHHTSTMASSIQIDKDIIAEHLTVPTIGLVYEPISIAVPHLEPNSRTWLAPESGIATPIEDLNALENTVYLFGHSRWRGMDQKFKRLEDIEIGTAAYVAGYETPEHNLTGLLKFQIERIIIADDQQAQRIMFELKDEDPRLRLVLQTSFKESDKTEIILDLTKLLHKQGLEVKTATNLNEAKPYIHLVVIGHQVPN